MDEQNDNEVILGGARIEGKDDYLKSITQIFYKINQAADTKNLNDLQWSMNFYTDVLISAILDRKARRAMQVAKEAIYQAELLKREATKKDHILTDQEEKQARVSACTEIIGECRQWFDLYFGFQTKLGVLL